MHLHFEKNPDTKCDCPIMSLSWMGKVPDNIPADDSWKLSRTNYYQEGWLATGNMRGTVGVTFTSSNYKKNAAAEFPQRTNFNLRGHRSEVILVKWNEPYQKLASCDSSGIIFVWIKYEGRWSIELINDRQIAVTHFSWSHDGRMALICYQDGFVLVGSVSGQRYWSSMLNLESTITCGIWTPDDQQVYFGTTTGQIIVMDVHGAMVSQVQVFADVGICAMAWSCEKFKMEEDEEMEPGVSNATKRSFVLAVSFTNGFIYLMKSFDDLAPTPINTELNGSLGFQMEWSNSRELLAVAGTAGGCNHAHTQTGRTALTTVPSRAHSPRPGATTDINVRINRHATETPTKNLVDAVANLTVPHSSVIGPQHNHHNHHHHGSTSRPSSSSSSSSSSSVAYTNMLKFYTQAGQLLFAVNIPSGPHASPVSALTWGHSDKRLFIATGAQIHIAWVSRRVASLQLLCRLQVQRCIGPESALSILPLPSKIKSLIGHLYAQTIRCSVPNAQSLREFVSRPPTGARLYCTMIRHDEEQNASSGVCYTLYLEYLGGLLPLLKGKRTSKIRPEFVIFDPQNDDSHGNSSTTTNGSSSNGDKISNNSSTMTSGSAKTDTSDSDNDAADFGKAVPRPHRKRKTKASSKSRHHSSGSSNNGGSAHGGSGAANGGAAGGSADSRTASLLAQADHDDELAYVDTLPEEIKLVEVNSNIWGTKFKIHGIAKNLPANLGQISYKTSLLHLQPRQMTVVVTELRDDLRHEPDPNFNPHIFSEDEDETALALSRMSQPVQSMAAPSVLLASSVADVTAVTGTDEAAGSGAPLPVVMTRLPRPNRLLPSRGSGSPSNSTRKLAHTPLGPLAKAESYEDDPFQSDSAHTAGAAAEMPVSPPSSAHKLFAIGASRPSGPSYSSLVSQYSRSSSNSSGQSTSRHAISPLCSDGAVPTLQSPKNAVAPSDIIFDRPPPTGLHTLSGNGGSGDCPATNVMVVKAHHSAAPAAATRKRGDLQFIDEDSGSSASAAPNTAAAVEPIMHRTPTIISIAPTAIVRSCSVGYLDTVEIIPSDVTLSILRKEAPNKRLVLFDRKPPTPLTGTANTTSTSSKSKAAAAARRPYRKKLLGECGKSRSLDSCDLQKVLAGKAESTDAEKTGDARTTVLLPPPMPKVHETSETEDSSSDVDTGSSGIGSAGQMGSDRDFLIVTYAPSPSPGMSASVKNRHPAKSTPFCIKCRIMSRECQCKISRKNVANEAADLKLAVRAKKENVTSFADSPLFTRKHRFGEGSSGSAPANARSPNLGKKHEFSFSFLKQLSEVRRRKRDDLAGASMEEREVQEQIDVDTKEGKDGERAGFTSLHSQALSTLENIISRLKDLEDNTRNGSNADMPASLDVRQPRSSPASPAPGKKKRNPSSSPIRQILNSPLLNRRNRKKQLIESSDEETPLCPNADEKQPLAGGSGARKDKQPYQDLETFQKAQLRQKLKRGKIEPNGLPSISQPAVLRREFVMHNKAPMWNENSQVYQLDFGGRVTQESAKNFQIEFRGQQVMQFGRIDGNAYTLDFQYPFSALQAFSVALANVTQRLK